MMMIFQPHHPTSVEIQSCKINSKLKTLICSYSVHHLLLLTMNSLTLVQQSVKSALKNEYSGKLAPIIKTRIPPGLQLVFLASNRGETVNVPPPSAVASICRNWKEVSTRSKLKRSACFDVPSDGLDSLSSIEFVDSLRDDCLCNSSSDFLNSSVDSCDLILLDELKAYCETQSEPSRTAVPLLSRWEATPSSLPRIKTRRTTSRWRNASNDSPPQCMPSSRLLSPLKSPRVFPTETVTS